ncbi:hypothetical protein CBR_g51449 [Chara braunii]|uniref:Nascent polypeptide-associated complex subunit alpha-like UBA domain-containing protein n=1 Tax=Chara braunii TaxID=69332 RepID=A0A388K6B5_CHABU|nr:hypothetical protein CBR_g51449 [Chara braunii]|eukprot:GBG65566.1 hypothetical protein CBR_g51449 [Chara braunii]
MADGTSEARPTGDAAAASRDQQQQSRALDSITDHVEERQLDSARVQQAMASITAASEADRRAQLARERELAAVRINGADVDIIVSELELEKKVAESMLREHKGDVVAALRSFL